MPIHGPKVNQAFSFYLPLIAKGTRNWKSNPTIAAGDFKISKNGGTEAALANTPTVEQTYYVKFSLTATEMNTPVVLLRCHDAAGDEWEDTGEQLITTTAGSGSGVVVSASASLVVDTTELANEVAPIVASLVANTLSLPSASQWQQIYNQLGVSGTTLTGSGAGILDLIYTAVTSLAYTSGNVNAELKTLSTAAQNTIKSLVFAALTDNANRFAELTGPPSATPTVGEGIMLLHMLARNARVETSTSQQLKNDSGTTVTTRTITANATSITIGELS